jgi:hypothetical protein
MVLATELYRLKTFRTIRLIPCCVIHQIISSSDSSTRSPFEPVNHVNSIFSLQVRGDEAGHGASSNQTQTSSDQDIMNLEEQVFWMCFLLIWARHLLTLIFTLTLSYLSMWILQTSADFSHVIHFPGCWRWCWTRSFIGSRLFERSGWFFLH